MLKTQPDSMSSWRSFCRSRLFGTVGPQLITVNPAAASLVSFRLGTCGTRLPERRQQRFWFAPSTGKPLIVPDPCRRISTPTWRHRGFAVPAISPVMPPGSLGLYKVRAIDGEMGSSGPTSPWQAPHALDALGRIVFGVDLRSTAALSSKRFSALTPQTGAMGHGRLQARLIERVQGNGFLRSRCYLRTSAPRALQARHIKYAIGGMSRIVIREGSEGRQSQCDPGGRR